MELLADMHCRSCEQRVERALRALDGVQAVRTDLKRQQVAVQFDERRVDESEVEAAVAGAASHRLPGG